MTTVHKDIKSKQSEAHRFEHRKATHVHLTIARTSSKNGRVSTTVQKGIKSKQS